MRPDLHMRFQAIVQRARPALEPDPYDPFAFPFAADLMPYVARLSAYSHWLTEMGIMNDLDDPVVDIAALASSLSVSQQSTRRFLIDTFENEHAECSIYRNP